MLNKVPAEQPARQLALQDSRVPDSPGRAACRRHADAAASALTGTDFDTRQVRIVEMMARRIAYVLQNAYDPATRNC